MMKHPTLLLLFIGGLLILCTGCISTNSYDNLTTSTNTPLTTASLITNSEAVPTTCPTSANITPWIRMDPVADHVAGENFSITGTTNLKIGERLSVSVSAYQPSANKKKSYDFFEVHGDTIVRMGNCSTNTWSFSDGLTTLRSASYLIVVTAENQTISGDFDLNESPVVGT